MFITTRLSKSFASILIIISAIAVLFCILLHFELHEESSSIKSLFDALWYFAVTITSVGYGDKYPVTMGGKLVGLFILIFSVIFLGYIVGNITNKITHYLERKKMGLNGTSLKGHIVIVGWNYFADLITKQIVNAGKNVAIITEDKADIDHIYEEYSENQVFCLYSNLKSVVLFKKANIEDSIAVFINMNDDIQKLITIQNLKKIFTNLNYIVTLDSTELSDTFKNAGVTFVLSKEEIASKLVASYIFEPDVADLNNDLLSTAASDEDCDIQQYLVTSECTYKNWKFGDLFIELKMRFNAVLIGVSQISNGERKLIKLPPNDLIINENDFLIIVLKGESESALSKALGVKEGIVFNKRQ